MTNGISATAPKARSFRSLDYYLMLYTLFVISAMGVYALVGMSDPKSKRKWLQEKKKKERRMENVAKVCFKFNTKVKFYSKLLSGSPLKKTNFLWGRVT